MRVQAFFLDVYCVYRIIGAATKAQYLISIGHFERLLGRPPMLGDLSDDALTTFVCVRAKEVSTVTANKDLTCLLAIARLAKRRGLLGHRPDVEKLPEKIGRPRCWQVVQFTMLLQEARKLPRLARTLEALLLLYYDTGLRCKDALAIDRSAADLDKRVVRATESKTGKERVFTIHEQTAKALRELDQGKKLIPYPFASPQPLRKVLRVALKAAGLPTSRKDLFQKIRRTAASHCERSGHDATKFLGHSARWVTLKFYLDEEVVGVADVANALPRPG